MNEKPSFEETEMIRAMQAGRDNSPERKEARVRARLAAEKAAFESRNLGSIALTDGDKFILAANHKVAKAAGLSLPGNWLTRFFGRIMRWFGARNQS